MTSWCLMRVVVQMPRVPILLPGWAPSSMIQLNLLESGGGAPGEIKSVGRARPVQENGDKRPLNYS